MSKVSTYIKSHPNFTAVLLVTIVTFLVVFILLINQKKPEDKTNNQDQEIISYPVSTPQNTPTSPTRIKSQLEVDLYESVKNKFTTQKISDCESRITNVTFPDLELNFDNCEWTVKFTSQSGIKLSAMVQYIDVFIIFTNKKTKKNIQINMLYPGVFEYHGPIATCYTSKNKVNKINDYVYRYELKYEDQGQILTKTVYESADMITQRGEEEFEDIHSQIYPEPYTISYPNNGNKDSAEVCILLGPQFSIDAKYSTEEIQIFKQLFSYDKDFNPTIILAYISKDKNMSDVEADNLITGFKM